jgi:hypothetical protein
MNGRECTDRHVARWTGRYMESGMDWGPTLGGCLAVRCYATFMKSNIFWDITPFNPFKINRHFEGTCRLHLQGRRVIQARNFITKQETSVIAGFLLGLFLDATCSSETSVYFQQGTRRYILEDRTLQNRCCESLKSIIFICAQSAWNRSVSSLQLFSSRQADLRECNCLVRFTLHSELQTSGKGETN